VSFANTSRPARSETATRQWQAAFVVVVSDSFQATVNAADICLNATRRTTKFSPLKAVYDDWLLNKVPDLPA
jgi:hypothetical protein